GQLMHVLAERDHTTFRQIVWIEDHLTVNSPISRPPDNGASEHERLSCRRPALALEAWHGGGRRGGAFGTNRDEFLWSRRRFKSSRPRGGRIVGKFPWVTDAPRAGRDGRL